jgi:hypothetical protein
MHEMGKTRKTKWDIGFLPQNSSLEASKVEITWVT